MKTIKLKIEGMHCASCSALSQKTLEKHEGVKEATVNLATLSAYVVAEDGVSAEDLCREIDALGFHATEIKDGKIKVEDTHEYNLRDIVLALVFAALIMYIGMSHMIGLPIFSFLAPEKNPLGFALSQIILLLPVLWCGRRFFINGIKMLLTLHPNMDSLVAIGSGASVLYSLWSTVLIAMHHHEAVHDVYFESAASVLALVLLGKYMEERSKNTAKDAISSLAALLPQTAVILKDGEKVTVKSEDIKKGDIVLVAAGEKISVDGIVAEGEGDVDESMLTGESLPVFKKPSSHVSGGTVCRDGMLKIKAESVGEGTAAARIAKLVSNAQAKKAPIARIADKAASVFVPAVMAIALLAAVIWIILGKDSGFVLKSFVSVLVVACPCALGLATPIAVMVASGRGAAGGLLYRGGDVIEKLAEVDAAIFDKTGTITEGKLRVSFTVPAENVTEEELIRHALAAEHGSLHPIAAGVANYAASHGITAEIPSKVISYAGRGVVAETPDGTVACGTARLMHELSAEFDEKTLPGAVIYVTLANKYIGAIGFEDTLRKNSAKAIDYLKKKGIFTAMITGDNSQAAETTAKETGIDTVYAEVLPEEKANYIKKLKDSGKTVAMTGDGINDAPACAEADVGVCVFGGTDIAAEVAGVLLMREDIMLFCDALGLSRFTMKIIRENLFWAFIYNIIGIPVAAGAFSHFGIMLTPAIAGLMMAFSSVCVVTNSLRIRRFKFSGKD